MKRDYLNKNESMIILDSEVRYLLNNIYSQMCKKGFKAQPYKFNKKYKKQTELVRNFKEKIHKLENGVDSKNQKEYYSKMEDIVKEINQYLSYFSPKISVNNNGNDNNQIILKYKFEQNRRSPEAKIRYCKKKENREKIRTLRRKYMKNYMRKYRERNRSTA